MDYKVIENMDPPYDECYFCSERKAFEFEVEPAFGVCFFEAAFAVFGHFDLVLGKGWIVKREGKLLYQITISLPYNSLSQNHYQT